MTVVMENLTEAAYPEFKTCSKVPSAESALMFVCSVLRCNLELEMAQRGGTPCLPLQSSLAAKKQCLLPLMHVLSLHSKILTDRKRCFIDLWSHITGVPPQSCDTHEAASQSLAPFLPEVPLLLKDASTLLIHLVLNMPATIQPAVYQCFVQALYNVQCVQALAMVACRFPEEERSAWQRGLLSSTSATSSPSSCNLHTLLVHMITLLEDSGLFQEDAESSTALPAICCQSVWSPQSVAASVQEACLPFLRVAALLKHHLFDSTLPQLKHHPEVPEEYDTLCAYLDLVHESSSSQCTRTHFLSSDWLSLLRAWCQHFSQFARKDASQARMLLCPMMPWAVPQLVRLPRVYDRVFQFYRKRTCTQCGSAPRDPALCLICAQMLCFKDRCCAQNTVYECVQHSRSCGGGTGLFLIVNSSIIVVIQGPRATAWGSIYLDEHGEEDHYLKRGRPLYLCEERLRLLQEEWTTLSFVRVCKKWIMHIDTL